MASQICNSSTQETRQQDPVRLSPPQKKKKKESKLKIYYLIRSLKARADLTYKTKAVAETRGWPHRPRHRLCHSPRCREQQARWGWGWGWGWEWEWELKKGCGLMSQISKHLRRDVFCLDKSTGEDRLTSPQSRNQVD